MISMSIAAFRPSASVRIWPASKNVPAFNLPAGGLRKSIRFHTPSAGEGVFAGGDLQTGPWIAIGAIAAGREAAESIVRYLDGRIWHEGPARGKAVWKIRYRAIPDETRQARTGCPMPPVEQRAGNFNEVELGYDENGRAGGSRAVPELRDIVPSAYQCVDACLAEAVDHGSSFEEREIDGRIRYSVSRQRALDPSGWRILSIQANPNVLTSLEFERILSASGPTMGHLVRPSDQNEPKKIAWLQCVGSRDTNRCGNGYCSSVCCMYAIKDAMVAKEHAEGDLDCVIFNMDIRTFGKDYEKYYLRARDKVGVRLSRPGFIPSTISRETGDFASDMPMKTAH